MESLFSTYATELLGTLIGLILFIIVRFLLVKTIRRIGKISDINRIRTRLVIRYVSFALSILLLVSLILIWGVNIRELGLIISSVFAVIGIGLFAIWSILSNVTSGIIMFFSFPYKVGDKIKIHDNDFPVEAVIEDIRAFHLHLRKDDGDLVTYPNNLMLQKAVTLVEKDAIQE